MAAAVLDLVGDKIIEQGSFWSIVVTYPGNITGAYFKGEIKKNYGDKAITNFNYNLAYREEDNKTLITFFLNSGQTTKLPIPEDDVLLLYDIKMTLPSKEPIRLIQGRADVSPAVTT